MSEVNNYCKLCGGVLTDGQCENAENHKFKRMCVNCNCVSTDENGNYVCMNEKNQKDAEDKVNAAIESAGIKNYNISVTLQPVPLKKPTLKCKEWTLSNEIKENIESLFV